MPPTLLKVVSWHELHQRAAFFWQVCFIELLEGGSSPVRNFVAAVCAEEKAAGLRDGIFLFVTQHLRPLIAASQPRLMPTLTELEESMQ